MRVIEYRIGYATNELVCKDVDKVHLANGGVFPDVPNEMGDAFGALFSVEVAEVEASMGEGGIYGWAREMAVEA